MSTAEVLQTALDIIRADGWGTNRDSRVPDIRSAIVRALKHVSSDEFYHSYSRARDAVSAALGIEFGGITNWETKPGRTRAEVEALLAKAIKEAT